MNWTLSALAGLLIVGGLAACSASSTPQPPGQTAGGGATVGQTPAPGQSLPPAGGAGGTSLAVRAKAVTDACTLMPTDLSAKIVPGGGAPQSQTYPPLQCTVSNGTQALQITIAPYDDVGPVTGTETIPGLGTAAYLAKPFPDDAYLTIDLDPSGGALYVEVAGHDGKDHQADAIAVAQYALAHIP